MELTDSVVDLKLHFAELNVAYSIHSATHYEVPIANADRLLLTSSIRAFNRLHATD